MQRPYISTVCLNKSLPYDSYLSDIPAIQFLAAGNTIEFTKNVTFLVGENGMGKSTLTEAIAVAYGFNAEGGSKNFSFSTKQSHSDLWKYLSLTKKGFAKDGFFLRAASFYNVATNIEEMDELAAAAPTLISSYGGISLHNQSHGESFMSLVQNRFGGKGLYILDEPEAALSPMRLLQLLREIDRLVKADSQLIIATHSPILMAYPGAEVLELSPEGIQKTTYQQTEHFTCSKTFFDDPERTMFYLLKG